MSKRIRYFNIVFVLALLLGFAPAAQAAPAPEDPTQGAPEIHHSNALDSTFPITETFTGSTAPGWTLYDHAQLTGGSLDPEGQGWLRLTAAINEQHASAILNTAFSSSEGVMMDFDYAVYGGTGADGIAFYLIDGATAAPTTGAYGGGLGYSYRHETGYYDPGVTNGYVGVGFDTYGNFSNTGYGDCTNGCPGRVPNRAVVRGSGNLHSGFEYLTGVPMPIGVYNRNNPYKVRVWIVDQRITVQMNGNTLIDRYDLRTAVNQDALPDTFKLGISGSTGGSTNNHEIRNLRIDLPRGIELLESVTPTSGAPGTPVVFTITAHNDGGVNASNATFTTTMPSALLNPTWTCVAGSGASCGDPSGAGAINQVVTLGEGSTLTYTLNATLGNTPGVVTHASFIRDANGLWRAQAEADVEIIDSGPRTLKLSKTAEEYRNDSPLYEGDRILYTIRVTNTSASALTNLIITDTLPAGVSFVQVPKGPSRPFTLTGQQVLWERASLAADATLTLQVIGEVDGSANPIGENQVAATCAEETTPITASAQVPGDGGHEPGMVVSGTVGGGSGLLAVQPFAVQADQWVYAVTVTNTNSANTMHTVIVSATVPSGAVLVSATPAGYTGVTTLTWTLPELGPGAVWQGSLTVEQTGALGALWLAAASDEQSPVEAVIAPPGGVTYRIYLPLVVRQ